MSFWPGMWSSMLRLFILLFLLAIPILVNPVVTGMSILTDAAITDDLFVLVIFVFVIALLVVELVKGSQTISFDPAERLRETRQSLEQLRSEIVTLREEIENYG